MRVGHNDSKQALFARSGATVRSERDSLDMRKPLVMSLGLFETPNAPPPVAKCPLPVPHFSLHSQGYGKFGSRGTTDVTVSEVS